MKAKKKKKTSAEYILWICLGGAILSMLFGLTFRGAAFLATILLTLSALGFVWISQYAPPRAVQILLTASLLTLWLPGIRWVSARIYILVDTVFFLAVACAALWVWFRKGKYRVPTAFAAVLILNCLSDTQLYTFVQNPGGLHFWQFALPFAVIGAVICILLLLQDKIQLEDNRLSERMLLPILVCGVCFCALWLTAENLNYALDASTPMCFETVVTEKRSEYHSRSGTHYYLTVQLNGDVVELSIYQGEYENVQIGDTYPVLQYDGAFGNAYYVPQSAE